MGKTASILFLLMCACGFAQTGTGVITTVAGTTQPGGSPQRGYPGDGGPATAAMLAFADVRNACDSRVNPDY